ncbi:hypothetical protein Bbelb_020070 [Branchiostoma belcheri]|nr:hypothetical protein Bbelb_020070 [Branchiostoma belcheri]
MVVNVSSSGLYENHQTCSRLRGDSSAGNRPDLPADDLLEVGYYLELLADVELITQSRQQAVFRMVAGLFVVMLSAVWTVSSGDHTVDVPIVAASSANCVFHPAAYACVWGLLETESDYFRGPLCKWHAALLTPHAVPPHPACYQSSPRLLSLLTLPAVPPHPACYPSSPRLLSLLTPPAVPPHPACCPSSPRLLSLLTPPAIPPHPACCPSSPCLLSLLTPPAVPPHPACCPSSPCLLSLLTPPAVPPHPACCPSSPRLLSLLTPPAIPPHPACCPSSPRLLSLLTPPAIPPHPACCPPDSMRMIGGWLVEGLNSRLWQTNCSSCPASIFRLVRILGLPSSRHTVNKAFFWDGSGDKKGPAKELFSLINCQSCHTAEYGLPHAAELSPTSHGAIFDRVQSDEEKAAFTYAVEQINADKKILPQARLIPQMETVENGDGLLVVEKADSWDTAPYECVLTTI